MKIEKDRYIRFTFTFTNEDGETVYQSDPEASPWYIHGHGLIMPVLEEKLAGHEEGDRFTFDLTPEQSFGSHYENLLFEAEKSQLPSDLDMELGCGVEIEMQSGDRMLAYIVEIKDETVILDGNHPLAGMDLTCTLNVEEVREPSEEEKLELNRYQSQRQQEGLYTMEFGPEDPNEEASSEAGCGCGCSCSSAPVIPQAIQTPKDDKGDTK